VPSEIQSRITAYDAAHHQVLFVAGLVVGWTGTRAQYAWQIMTAPAGAPDQVVFSEARPCEGTTYPYRGEAFSALRQYAQVHHLAVFEKTTEAERDDDGYIDALEQEIHELHAAVQMAHWLESPSLTASRLRILEKTISQLGTALRAHFQAIAADEHKIRAILQTAENDLSE